MRILRAIIVAHVMLLSIYGFAVMPEVTDVTAKQRRPWNGLVDITCKVTGIEGTTNKSWFAVEAANPGTNEVREVSHVWILRDGTKSTDLAVRTNGDYHIIWDARADLGKVRCTNMVVWANIIKHNTNKVQLWKDGPYWAETNIGAEEPWDYGYYFWWGDTVGYKRENNAWVASDGSSLNFSFSDSNTPTYNKSIENLQNEGWITAENILAPAHDAAQVQWGGGWRMPTNQELEDLCYNKCDWTWTTTNGVNGYVVRGRGDYVSSSIFLPAENDNGNYWSSVPNSGNDFYAWGLYSDSSNHYTGNYVYRYFGRSVRPVQGFTKERTK